MARETIENASSTLLGCFRSVQELKYLLKRFSAILIRQIEEILLSKLLNIGTFCGGLSGLVVGAIAVFQLFSPAKLETPSDLITALAGIEEALKAPEFQIDTDTAPEVEQALNSFSATVVQSARQSDGGVPFVPRTSLGVYDYPHEVPIDFVAPNGESKLLYLNVFSAKTITVAIDGTSSQRVSLGRNIAADFANLVCTFEVISIVVDVSVTLRSRCD